MSAIRKTVRFHTDNAEDMKILEAVSNYKSHGFHSTSDMILAALRGYFSGNDQNYSPEELADLIAERLSGKLVMPSDTGSLQQASPERDKAFDIAMDFINSL